MRATFAWFQNVVMQRAEKRRHKEKQEFQRGYDHADRFIRAAGNHPEAIAEALSELEAHADGAIDGRTQFDYGVMCRVNENGIPLS